MPDDAPHTHSQPSQPAAEPGTWLVTQPTVSSQSVLEALNLRIEDGRLPASLGKGIAPYPHEGADAVPGFLSDENLSQPPALGPLDTHAVTPELGGYIATSSTKAEEPAPPSASAAPGLPKMFNIFMPRNAQRVRGSFP